MKYVAACINNTGSKSTCIQIQLGGSQDGRVEQNGFTVKTDVVYANCLGGNQESQAPLPAEWRLDIPMA